jgi:glycosyltransferase involved in cell wall biosynthesis
MDSIQKPRLLFVYPNQFGYHTDSYKYCEHLNTSFDITYICFDQGFERLVQPGVEVIYMPYNTGKLKRLAAFYSEVFKFTRNTRTAIIFTIQFKFCFLIGLFARSGVKLLDYRTGDLSPGTFVRRLNNILMRFDALFFRHISVISAGLREILHLSKVKTHILPLGADVLSARTHSSERMDLLYVGSLNSRNIHQTIEGIAIFLSKNKHLSSLVSYTIIGFGKNQDVEKITGCIENLRLNDTVHFLGRKRYTDLPAFFDACNIGVSYVPVTPWYEHQPVTKLFEYMLSGMPVIATNTYENRLIVNNINGVLINDTPEDFCNGLQSIYDRRNSYNSSEIRKSVEAYTWENIVNTNLKPYLLGLMKTKVKAKVKVNSHSI